MLTDLDYMSCAIALAKRGLFTVRVNPRVGCLIVKDNVIAGEGWHQQTGELHAETMALQQAGEQANGATCYITLEPCTHYGKTPPCVEALIKAGIKRVVVAALDPNPVMHNQGIAALQQAGIAVETGCLAEESAALNSGFFQRMQTGKPVVRVKLGASLDGRTALANGKSQWITGEAARHDVQYWRARSCAILTSSETVLHDNPQLNVRDAALVTQSFFQQPKRVVLDQHLRTSPRATIYAIPDEVTVITATDTFITESWKQAHVPLVTLPVANGHMDLVALMQWFAEQQMNEVWVEAGPRLAGALCAAQLVDEWIIYLAPKLLGPQAKPLLELPELSELSNAVSLKFTDYQLIGPDLRVTAVNK